MSQTKSVAAPSEANGSLSQHEQHRQVLLEFQQRKAENLLFFASYSQEIYQQIQHYRLNSYQIDIRLEENEVDLITKNQRLYNGTAKKYAQYELEQFIEVSGPGRYVKTIDPASPGDFKFPRFFNQIADQMVRASPVAGAPLKEGYCIGNSYPCLVFMGVGLGYHIEAFLDQYEVNTLIIYEPIFERFFASLYTIDWKSIVTNQNNINHGKEIILKIDSSNNPLNEELLSLLKEYSPQYPLFTLFYNHLAEKDHERVIDEISDNSVNHLITWGNYDDEVNQLNQAIYNIVQRPTSLPDKIKHDNKVPVCIVGAGPSLDNRIESLRGFEPHAVIIACGTAINALYANNIKPDILVVLESDHIALHYIELIEKSGVTGKSYLKNITLVGPIHLNSKLIERFQDYRFYIKKECGLSDILEGMGLVLEGGAPTCTNLGVAIATYYAFNKIFLFGLDFGFLDIEKHHSKDTVYYHDDDQSNKIHNVFTQASDYSNQMLLEDRSVLGEKIFTDPFYYASKTHIEYHIEKHTNIKGYDFEFINCSDGAEIKHTSWVDKEKLVKIQEEIISCKKNKQPFLQALFNGSRIATPINFEIINSRLNNISISLAELQQKILHTLEGNDHSKQKKIENLVVIISGFVRELQCQNRPLYTLTRGSIWYMLLIGLSQTMSIETKYSKENHAKENERTTAKIKRDDYYYLWSCLFRDFLKNWSNHFNSVIKNSASAETNIWLDISLHDPEPKRSSL